MRGILMIELLYHQTVAGKKTQTRRSGGLEQVNGCKATKTKPAIVTNPDNWEETGASFVRNKHGVCLESTDFCDYKDTQRNVVCKPRYKMGEVLFIKEPTAKAKVINGKQVYAYRYGCNGHKGMIAEFAWENKLYMPADRARAFIRITGIKCERLLDISDEDCIAEGIERDKNDLNGKPSYPVYGHNLRCDSPKLSFLNLYKFANKVKEVPNLWVWCYSFEYLKDYQP